MKSLNKSLTNIRRRPYQALSAILVLSITFFIIILVSIASVAIEQTLTYFESRPQVLIFFNADATENEIFSLRDDLTNSNLVTDVTYVPQEEALEIYQELNKNDPLLLELVTSDILPASLEVSTISIESLKQVAADSAKYAAVDEVVLRTEVIDVLNKWLFGIRVSGITFISIMVITSLLITAIVVGMKISSRNHEIQVLKLIGASNWYIQGPYLYEGAIYGIISSVIANFTAVTLLLYSTPIIIDFGGEVPLLPQSPMILVIIFVATTLGSALLGIIGSWIAVKRYIQR